jgi:hypothetical protein
VISAWAVEGDLDPAGLKSNRFPLEWPSRSGRIQELPEVDRGGWFALADAILPYGIGNFRFSDSDAGTLSTHFAAAVAYATFVGGLFGLQVILRKALVYGVLLAFMLAAYSSAVFLRHGVSY